MRADLQARPTHLARGDRLAGSADPIPDRGSRAGGRGIGKLASWLLFACRENGRPNSADLCGDGTESYDQSGSPSTSAARETCPIMGMLPGVSSFGMASWLQSWALLDD